MITIETKKFYSIGDGQPNVYHIPYSRHNYDALSGFHLKDDLINLIYSEMSSLHFAINKYEGELEHKPMVDSLINWLKYLNENLKELQKINE